MIRRPPSSTPFPYTPLSRSAGEVVGRPPPLMRQLVGRLELPERPARVRQPPPVPDHLGVRHLRLHVGIARLDLLHERLDRKSTRLNSVTPISRMPSSA